MASTKKIREVVQNLLEDRWVTDYKNCEVCDSEQQIKVNYKQGELVCSNCHTKNRIEDKSYVDFYKNSGLEIF